MSIYIIIPYFQRTPGVLTKAIRSVLAQTYQDWRLIIVDDGSPHPAEAELSGFDHQDRAKIHIIQQSNGGVSAARNCGLANVGKDAKFVAFLDSDDEWTDDHLERAINALGNRADAFWGHVATDGTFDTDSTPGDIVPLALREQTPSDNTYVSQKLASILTGEWWRHMHISTLVLRADLARRLRFDRRLKSTEDLDFFRQIAEHQPVVTFSDRTSVRRGIGDNIWHDLDFTDTRVAQERLNTLRQLHLLSRIAGISADERRLLRLRCEVAREQFIWNQFGRRKKGDKLNFGIFGKWLLSDPMLLRTFFRLKFQSATPTELPVEPTAQRGTKRNS